MANESMDSALRALQASVAGVRGSEVRSDVVLARVEACYVATAGDPSALTASTLEAARACEALSLAEPEAEALRRRVLDLKNKVLLEGSVRLLQRSGLSRATYFGAVSMLIARDINGLIMIFRSGKLVSPVAQRLTADMLGAMEGGELMGSKSGRRADVNSFSCSTAGYRDVLARVRAAVRQRPDQLSPVAVADELSAQLDYVCKALEDLVACGVLIAEYHGVSPGDSHTHETSTHGDWANLVDRSHSCMRCGTLFAVTIDNVACTYRKRRVPGYREE